MAPGRQHQPSRWQFQAAHIIQAYFDPGQNPRLPLWLYNLAYSPVFKQFPEPPSPVHFERFNKVQRVSLVTRMTAVLNEHPCPDLLVERKRLEGLCVKCPDLIIVKREIFAIIMDRVLEAKTHYQSIQKSLADCKAIMDRPAGSVLQIPGSTPLKPHGEGRKRSSATV